MSIYLKKFETQSAYEAAESSLILPNVSLTVDNNTVHYNPSSPIPPTLSITAITDYDGEQVETPFCDNGNGAWLHFNRPVSFNELQSLLFEVCICWEHEEGLNTVALVDSTIKVPYIEFTSPDREDLYIDIYKFEGTVDSVQLSHSDDSYWFNSISI